LGALVDCNQFSWQPYLKEMPAPPTQTIADWVLKFEQHYFQRRARNSKSESTWHNDYAKVFKHLPAKQPLTGSLLFASILKTTPDTRNRKRYCIALAALAKFAGLVVQKSPEELIYAEYHSETRVTEWGTTWDAQVCTQKVIQYVNPPPLSSTANSTLVNGFVHKTNAICKYFARMSLLFYKLRVPDLATGYLI
jgi:hypothetical protein